MNAYAPVRRALFNLDPERAHNLTLGALRVAGRSALARRWLSSTYSVADPRLRVRVAGLDFPNPLGLAAGLDKDGVAVSAFAAMGFGSIEVGSVTHIPQSGSERPRLFRLEADRALINRMGFNNRGALALAHRLSAARRAGALVNPNGTVPLVGVNVGKSRAADLTEAAADYRAALNAVRPVADYLVVNVSSPNTPGLRSLQEREQLRVVLTAALKREDGVDMKPLFLKLSPDMHDDELVDAALVADSLGAAGLIATNTTVAREALTSPNAREAGGLSGAPLAKASLRALEKLRESTTLPIVSVGGIMSAGEALDRILAGADLLQIYTGFIYGGPPLVREIMLRLVREMEARGVTTPAALRG